MEIGAWQITDADINGRIKIVLSCDHWLSIGPVSTYKVSSRNFEQYAIPQDVTISHSTIWTAKGIFGPELKMTCRHSY